MVKFVSAYVERDKKNFEKMDFCAQLPARFTPLKRRGGFLLATDFTDFTATKAQRHKEKLAMKRHGLARILEWIRDWLLRLTGQRTQLRCN